MTLKDADHLENRFLEYVSRFYTDDPFHDRNIKMKEKHTFRVCEKIIMLGQSLNMSADDLHLARTMALFHDFGRFRQYEIYKTFSDKKSENHAELGLKEITRLNILSGFEKKEKSLITKAIACHNARTLDEISDETELFFARLLRDADKLDIWEFFNDHFHSKDKQPNATLVVDLPDEPHWSEEIINSLAKDKIAPIESMKTQNDYKLIQLGWVFDLNFKASFHWICNRKIIEKIASTLPRSNGIDMAVSHVLDYSKSRCKKATNPHG